MHKYFIYILYNYIASHDDYGRAGQTYCAIDSSTLLFTGGRDSSDSLGGSYRPWLLRFPVAKDDSQGTLALPTTASTFSTMICVAYNKPICPEPEKWIQCEDLLPVSVVYHSLTKVREGSIILIGGIGRSERGYRPIVSKEVLMGTLASDKENILWEKLPSLNFGRWSHVTFKIDNVIYVAGGFDDSSMCSSSCEEYSLATKIWRKSDYELPYPLANAVVEVDSQQKFAIIAGGILSLTEESSIQGNPGKFEKFQDTSKIISFSKEHGFREVGKFELQKPSRYGSNAIAIRY